MDSNRLNALGWQPQIGLEAGLAAAYEDFQASSLREQRCNPSPSQIHP
jgi:nucleoside-diphosphate-sugar epimerase